MRICRIIFTNLCLLVVAIDLLPVEVNPPVHASGILYELEQSKVVARKFDEFELTAIAFGDMKALLDRFYSDGLMTEPNSRAYAILYRGRRRSSRYYPLQVRDWLVNTRGFPANRVKAVYGGYREVPMLELWVVPEGAAFPKATPTVFLKRRRKH